MAARRLIDFALRAADALHLAVAALGGHALATLDARLAEGAQAGGGRGVGVSSVPTQPTQ